ncbi:hypothetical protein CRENBAI_009123, partial [Crenichthys baileyi]
QCSGGRDREWKGQTQSQACGSGSCLPDRDDNKRGKLPASKRPYQPGVHERDTARKRRQAGWGDWSG